MPVGRPCPSREGFLSTTSCHSPSPNVSTAPASTPFTTMATSRPTARFPRRNIRSMSGRLTRPIDEPPDNVRVRRVENKPRMLYGVEVFHHLAQIVVRLADALMHPACTRRVALNVGRLGYAYSVEAQMAVAGVKRDWHRNPG